MYVQCSVASMGLTQAHPNENTLHQYNFTTKIHLTTTHQHFPNCGCPYIFMVASNTTQQAISLSPAISSARSAISSINAHPRLVKLFPFNLVCAKMILREYFFDENLLDEIKANYGMYMLYLKCVRV